MWQQAIALLMGLKVRNGFGEKDLAGAVERALHRGTRARKCEDCSIKVASGARGSRGPGAAIAEVGMRGAGGPLGLAITKPAGPPPPTPPVCIESPGLPPT